MKNKFFGQVFSVKKITLSLLVAFLTLPVGFTSHATGGSEESHIEQYNEDMERVGGYVPLETGKGQVALRKACFAPSYRRVRIRPFIVRMNSPGQRASK